MPRKSRTQRGKEALEKHHSRQLRKLQDAIASQDPKPTKKDSQQSFYKMESIVRFYFLTYAATKTLSPALQTQIQNVKHCKTVQTFSQTETTQILHEYAVAVPLQRRFSIPNIERVLKRIQEAVQEGFLEDKTNATDLPQIIAGLMSGKKIEKNFVVVPCLVQSVDCFLATVDWNAKMVLREINAYNALKKKKLFAEAYSFKCMKEFNLEVLVHPKNSSLGFIFIASAKYNTTFRSACFPNKKKNAKMKNSNAYVQRQVRNFTLFIQHSERIQNHLRRRRRFVLYVHR